MEATHHNAIQSVFKAGMVMVAGWFFAGWLLFLLIAAITMVSQA